MGHHVKRPAGEIGAAGFGVVCFAGSAGALQAYREILGNLRPDTGMAFVIVSHRGRGDSAPLLFLLRGWTAMPVVEVLNGMLLEPNRIFVSPAHAELSTDGIRLYLRVAPEARGWPVLVTVFLRSLARQCGSRATAAILSGRGNDGVAALGALKAGGGATYAQGDAEYDSMPMSAVATGNVDFVLTAAGIGRHLSLSVESPAP